MYELSAIHIARTEGVFQSPCHEDEWQSGEKQRIYRVLMVGIA
jgi:hypothetical protein